MRPLRIRGATRNLGAPKGWKDDEQGPCMHLPILDVEAEGVNYMVSRWELTPQELIALNSGAAIELWISGTHHPVIRLGVQTDVTG